MDDDDDDIEPEIDHFLGAFHWEMEKRKNEKSFYTNYQFNYLMADLWGAGVDTTITTLRWFLFYVAHDDKIQVREGDGREGEGVEGVEKVCLTFFFFYKF